jgi:hypothetical protein
LLFQKTFFAFHSEHKQPAKDDSENHPDS